MKYIGRFLGWILLGINALCVLFMWLCALSPLLPPAKQPLLACLGLAFPLAMMLNFLFLLFWFIIYRKYMLLSLVALLTCAQCIWTNCPLNLFQKEVPEEHWKVLTYNVMKFSDDEPNTEAKPNEILTYLQGCGADVLCLQEFGTNFRLRMSDIEKALSNYPYHHVYSIHGGGNALACFSRHPILAATPIDYASEGNGSIIYRIDMGGDTLTVVNNHLESNHLSSDDRSTYEDMIKDPETKKVKTGARYLLRKLASTTPTRAEQADSVAAAIRRLPQGPLVVCGDFNTSAISYPHRVIGKGLTDAFSQSGRGFGISFHKNMLYFRIDQLFISNDLRSYRCTVDSSIGASDHYPLWCYISKK
jgi:endonuclease/exonuclease/phosphatase family metal-dependent hydrolase